MKIAETEIKLITLTNIQNDRSPSCLRTDSQELAECMAIKLNNTHKPITECYIFEISMFNEGHDYLETMLRQYKVCYQSTVFSFKMNACMPSKKWRGNCALHFITHRHILLSQIYVSNEGQTMLRQLTFWYQITVSHLI